MQFVLGQIIEGAWKTFEEMCIHKDAGPTQRAEMKKAFFGGAQTSLTVMLAASDDTVAEENANAILESMHNEVYAFAQSLPNNGQGGLTGEELKTKQ